MSIGTKTRPKKGLKAKSQTENRTEPTRIEVQDAPRGMEPAPTHVVGKPAEIEPSEYAARPLEEPEAAMRSAEAPDAGYGRCTESSDWENRGRS